MKALRYPLLIIALVFSAYLLFFPVPIDPVAWQPGPIPSMQGPFAANNRLSEMEVRFKGLCPACEDVAIDSLGRVYGGAETGEILRLEKGKAPYVMANTGGRPLGLHFDKQGALYIADAKKGLLRMDPNGKLTVLATEYGGKAFGFADDLEIAEDGVVYFSDASWRFSSDRYKLDLMEHRPNGRLLAYDPAKGQLSLLLDSLYFANGIAVAHDQSFVLVNETGAYRIRRYWLKGPLAGQHDLLIDNLPAFPDGVSQGSDGIFWVALASPRKAVVDKLMPKPFLRKVITRLPDFLQPAPTRFGFVLGLDKTGKVVYNFQDPTGKFTPITSVQEWNQQLYLGSLSANGVGVFNLKKD